MNSPIATIGTLQIDGLHAMLVGLFLISVILTIWLWPFRTRATRHEAAKNRLVENMAAGEKELASEAVRREIAEARLEELEQSRRTLQLRLEEAEKNLKSAEVRGEERARAFDEERKQMTELRKEVEDRFREIANSALKQSQSLFLETANETFGKQKEAAEGNLKALVSPIREAIGKFELRVEGLEKVRAEDKSAIFEQVKSVGEMLARNQAVTSKLVTALSSPKGGGRWGEESLRNVMEMAGLSEYADFSEQVGNAGDGLRPDVIIRMPGGREIVVDSKVSIDDFLRAAEDPDEERRKAFLVAHARKLKDHVKRLASKEYWKAFDNRVDFVAMYVPGENFYAAALQVERDLFDFAARNKVLIVTPSTLIALAKAVSYGWRQEEAAKNALEAAQMGRDLHKRLSTFTDHMEKVGTHLGRSVAAFNKMNGSYERMVMPQARKFEALQLNESGTTLSDVTLLEEFPSSGSRGLLGVESDDDDDGTKTAAE
ncbi:MAG: DNA recombination protein RmuC [Ponticaulis sp.]|nr:DNA recombination protein RmuC [Ponticaulis sp.]